MSRIHLLVIFLPLACANAPENAVVAEAAKGPFESTERFCEAERAATPDPPESLACQPEKLKKKPKLKGPWAEVAPFLFGQLDVEQQGYLGVRVGTDWFAVPLGGYSENGADHGYVEVKAIQVKDVVPGDPPELLVTVHRGDLGYTHDYEEFGTHEKVLFVCGVGASGQPSCASFPTSVAYDPHPLGDEEEKPYRFKVKVTFDKKGQVVRKIAGKLPKGLERGEYEGTNPLHFP